VSSVCKAQVAAGTQATWVEGRPGAAWAEDKASADASQSST
jgi:hypothetical protein